MCISTTIYDCSSPAIIVPILHSLSTNNNVVMVLQSHPSPSLQFTVRRRQPELVTPVKPTPRELKPLSDIDSQEGLRFQVPFIMLYRHDPSMEGIDPVGIIRRAVAETLVYYYPLAGRLREGEGRKLMVDCTAEGVLFIEADADDVTLDQFGDILHPPFPCFDELLHQIPASQEIINSPLLVIQVTRLKCGGFIMAVQLNHAVCDGPGLLQFLKALSETTKGASQPSVLPVWHRELLTARNPPRVTRIHHEYDEQVPYLNQHPIFMSVPPQDIIQHSFCIRPSQIAALRRQLPAHLARSSSSQILAACLWRCRTIALQPPPEAEVRLMSIVGIRTLVKPPLPVGYYGNGFMYPAVVSAAGKLMDSHFGYALELIRKGKTAVDEVHVQSLVDLTVAKGRPHHTTVGSFIVLDMTHAGFEDVDVGWGKAVYGGIAEGQCTLVPEMTSNFVSSVNSKGERLIVMPISLPAPAMEVFATELFEMLSGGPQGPSISAPRIMSCI